MPVTINVKINGLNEVLSALQDKQTAAKQAEYQVVLRVAIRLRDVIVQFVDDGHPDHPEVQKGRLKSSIRYAVEQGATTVGYVGSDADYAPHVEFGHSQTPGRFVPALGKRLKASEVKPYPFVRPAITQVFDGGEAEAIARNTVKEYMA